MFCSIKDGVDRLHGRQDDRERDEMDQIIHNWISPVDYTLRQNDFMGRRQEGTGLWLLESREYQDWLCNIADTLFCRGIPGAGKTILISIVVNNLYSKIPDSETGIAYIYCNYKRHDEQTAVKLLASLLRQLSHRLSSLPEHVNALYDKHNKNHIRTRPSVGEISRTLQSVAAMYSRVSIIVDALDECQQSDGCRTEFLRELFNLQSKTEANIFVTSRFIPEIEVQFKGCCTLEIRASENDIRQYLKTQLPLASGIIGRNSDLQQKAEDEIIKVIDGM
jgi:Cdc6-like AAA superfamily ATPase